MPLTTKIPRPRSMPSSSHHGVLPETEQALDQATVAELSSKEISRMTRSELVRVVQTGRIPQAPVSVEQLDRGTLERLAYLARLSCQNQT